MPIAYTAIRDLTRSTKFQERLQVALWREASKIVRQASPDPAQLAWARANLKGPSDRILEATIRVCTTGAVYQNGDAVDDDTLQTVVAIIVPDLAAS